MTGEQIKELRIELGKTQDEMADLLGYSGRSMICHLESGYTQVTPRVAKLCQLLKEKYGRNNTASTS